MSLRRLFSIVLKELRQLRRDRLTFAMIVGIPTMQLLLFGFAINLDIRHLDAAVLDRFGYWLGLAHLLLLGARRAPHGRRAREGGAGGALNDDPPAQGGRTAAVGTLTSDGVRGPFVHDGLPAMGGLKRG